MRHPIVTGLFAIVVAVLTIFAAPAAMADGEALHGKLVGPDRAPVQGVTITVTQGGQEVGAATSGADGAWTVAVPKAGSFDITLDTASLPKTVMLRNKGGDALKGVVVRPSQVKNVLFPLIAAGAQQSTTSATPGSSTPTPSTSSGSSAPGAGSELAQALVDGIKYGAIIAITAIGLSLVFGTTRLINFAHGEYVTLGAMVAFFFNAAASGPGLPLVIAALLAIVVGGLFGGASELWLWRPLRKRGTGLIQMFIISIGLSLLLRHVILVFFKSQPQPYGDYIIQDALHFGPVTITPRDLVIVVLSVIVILGVGLMLQRTRIGRAMRAVSDNRDLAEASGIDVERVILIVWMLAGALAAIGGIFFGLSQILAWDMGFKLLLLMFSGVILGGLGSAYGAIVGSFVIGIVATVSTLWLPVELQNAWALIVLILVLLVRPQGILGRRERIG